MILVKGTWGKTVWIVFTKELKFKCHLLWCCDRWLTVSADHIVILILLLALAVKFVFFEVKDDLTSMHRPGSYARIHSSKLLSSDFFIAILCNFNNLCWILWLSGWHFCLYSGRSWVQILVWKLAIKTGPMWFLWVPPSVCWDSRWTKSVTATFQIFSYLCTNYHTICPDLVLSYWPLHWRNQA